MRVSSADAWVAMRPAKLRASVVISLILAFMALPYLPNIQPCEITCGAVQPCFGKALVVAVLWPDVQRSAPVSVGQRGTCEVQTSLGVGFAIQVLQQS